MIVIYADMRALGYCSKGAREWFAQHGLDYRQFVRSGLDADTLLATGDAMAVKTVEQAKKREAQQT
ncbi:MAG: hypothetical protein VXW65_01995 [Pseudomonadota bacterium]|nr:hypothetical protein [Pseudomonadota bacterium]